MVPLTLIRKGNYTSKMLGKSLLIIYQSANLLGTLEGKGDEAFIPLEALSQHMS